MFNEKLKIRVRILSVYEIGLGSDELVQNLLEISRSETVCFLDSCGTSYLGSHLLIAGVSPIEVLEVKEQSAEKILKIFDRKLSVKSNAAIFTISYDFGLKLEEIKSRPKESSAFFEFPEPDIFLATFDCLIVHDYRTGKTYLKGNEEIFDKVAHALSSRICQALPTNFPNGRKSRAVSNFTRSGYVATVEKIKEKLRAGDSYQTNLTQKFYVELPDCLDPQNIYLNLRRLHPAPFAAFIKRKSDFVISISPERFAYVSPKKSDSSKLGQRNTRRFISVSPVKGTRPRGKTKNEDIFFKTALLFSKKDRAENIMIVDLLRNDIGKICELGSIKVEKLCDLETHPSLFHLVSTVTGNLKSDINFGDVIKAIFPCGSITGCPKISTMQIIDEFETSNRGLSMGAMGYVDFDKTFDLNVAIRTMVIRNQKAIFNVGGGIVIDSKPEDEYHESLLKAKAILEALNAG